MRLSAGTLASTTLAILMLCATPALAQPESVVRGEVVDTSGGVLPGVTVLATSADGRVLATTVTNEQGRYVLSGLPAGPIKLTFRLDGFETANVELKIQPRSESWVAQPLRLAQITENVVVYGKAPVEASPPPSPPIYVPYRRPPPPVVIPVPIQEMESFCGPAKPGTLSESIGTIHSHRHEAGRTLYAKGDELNIEGGTLNGLEVGRNLVVRRFYKVDGPEVGPLGVVVTGEHTAGLVQIVAANQRSSTAVVVHACNELMQGDFLASFHPQLVRTPDPAGVPTYGDAARILFADAGQMLGAPRRLMVIDRGSEQGIHPGQRLTIFRGENPEVANPVVIGEAMVVSVRIDSATIRLENTTDGIRFGDWAAPQRPSPADLPVAKKQ